MKFSIPVFTALLFVTNMSFSSTTVTAIFPHHSMGALLLGSRSQGDESLYAKPEQMHLCRRMDELNRAGEINLVIHHHDRDKWDSLRDCKNNLIEDSWGEIPMGSDGNTPEHWNSLFIENQWPDVKEKLLAYDVIIIKNSYQTVQDDHSPNFKEDPAGAFTIVDKMELWKGYLNALGEYFSTNYPDKTLVHLGPAPRRALGREWWNPLHYFTRGGSGINYPSQAVARSSRQFADWMNHEWQHKYQNVHYFPWFDRLADQNHVMDERWRSYGSHYQLWRGREVGVELADFVYEIVSQRYPLATE